MKFSRIKSFFDPQIVMPCAMIAVLVALAFPPIGIWPLAWLAFVGWALLFSKSAYHRERAPLFFFWYSFLVHLFGFYWIAYTFHEFADMPWALAALLTVLGLAVVGLSSMFWGWVYLKCMQRWPRARSRPLVILAIFWMIWDVCDFRIYPWTPVMSVGGWDILMSSAGYLGTGGWRVWFFASAALIAFLLTRTSTRRERMLNVFSAVVVIWALPVCAGFWNRKVLMELYPNSQTIAILQGNVGNSYKKNAKLGEVPSVRKIVSIYRDLVEEASIHFFSETEVDPAREPIYFWPETAFPGFWDQPDFLGLELRSWVARSKGLHLVGAYENGPIQLGAITKDVDFNVLAIMGSKHKDESYRKMIRMPFGEYIPGDQWFPEAYRWLPAVNHFGAGESYKLLNTAGQGPVMVPLICYEILFEGFVNRFVKKARAEYPDRDIVLVNPSNDSWYGLTSQPFQNVFLSRWHAARLRLPLVRPANTGISVVVAPWGEVLAESHLDEPEVIYSGLPIR